MPHFEFSPPAWWQSVLVVHPRCLINSFTTCSSGSMTASCATTSPDIAEHSSTMAPGTAWARERHLQVPAALCTVLGVIVKQNTPTKTGESVTQQPRTDHQATADGWNDGWLKSSPKIRANLYQHFTSFP